MKKGRKYEMEGGEEEGRKGEGDRCKEVMKEG